MIYRDIFKRLEVQAEELVSCIEYTFAHVLHLEIRLGLLFIKSIFRLAYLLRIICPVPRLYL